MVNLLTRRAMMTGEAEEPGIEFSNLGSVIFENSKSSGTMSISYVSYNGTTMLAPAALGNALAGGGTRTLTNVLTDGTHFWISTGGTVNGLTYNNESVSYKRSSGQWQITLPPDFDNTVPFVFS